MTPVLAVDCDLGRIHCWCSVCGEVCRHAPNLTPIINHVCGQHGTDHPVVLFEIASPVSGARESGNAVLYRVTKWIIWNVAQAVLLDRRLPGIRVSVSPSNTWTRGHDKAVRHRLCNAQAKLKDLRDCEAMIWSMQHDPRLWKPLDLYLASLCG